MTEGNSGPQNPESQSPRTGSENNAQTPAAPRKKKRRLILKSLIGLVVVIVVLVILAPTLISTGVVRDMVVSKVNSSALNGKLEIKDWSFGWTSGVHIQGVQLDDENNEHLVSVGEISTPISLLKAATGTVDLGDVTVKGVDFNARLDSKGELNILQAIKPSNTPPNPQPAKLPNIKGTLHVEDVTGTFQDDMDQVTVGLPQESPLNATVAIKDINQPIEDSVDLGVQVDEKNLIKVKVEGTVSAIQNNLVAADKLAASQTIELSQGDLSALSQVLHKLHLDLDVAGKLSGKIVATVNTPDNISADMGMDVADFAAGGKQLAGDTLALRNCQVGLKASIASTDGKNAHIKLDLPAVIQVKGSAAANHLAVHADVAQDSLMGMGDVLQAIAARLGRAQAGTTAATIPGTGKIEISADFNVADLVSQVPDVLHLEKGTSLTSGELTHDTTITLGDGKAVISSDTKLKDFAGSANGSPVKLSDIDASVSLTAVGGDRPDLRDVNIGLTSAFADVKGGGATLGKLSLSASSDLKNLQQQIGQVIDLDALLKAPAGSHVSFEGTLSGGVQTNGDLTADESDIAFNANFNANAVKINIPGRRSINEPKLSATVAANLHHAGSQFIQAVHDLKLAAQSPAVNFAADGNVTMGGKFGVQIPGFRIEKGTIDLRLAQEEFGGALSLFVPPAAEGQTPSLMQRIADNSLRVASGSVNISGEGKFDQTGFGFQQPLAIQMQPADLTIIDEMGTAQTVHVPAMSVVISGAGTVDSQSVALVKNLTLETLVGTAASPLFDLQLGVDASVPLGAEGTISASRIELAKLAGDLPGLQTTFGPLIQLMTPASAAQNAPSVVQMLATNQLSWSSGQLSGSMLASFDGKTLSISKPLTVNVSGLTVVNHGAAAGQDQNVLNNETMQLTVSAQAAGDFSWIHDLDVGVDTSLARIHLSNGQILLAKLDGGKLAPVGPLDQLQSVDVEVEGVNLARVDGVFNRLFNEAATPAPGEKVVVVVPPPQVTSGTASLKLNISHSGNATTANVTEAVVHGLAIKSAGAVTSWPSDIKANFSAELDTRSDATADMPVMDQLADAKLTALSVDSGIGTTIGLIGQKPIVASDLNDPANMSVDGGIHIGGDIPPVARVAEAFSGAKPNSYPYLGHFDLNESVSKVASQPRLHIRGGGAITQFVVMGQPGPNGAAAQTLFSENNISIENPLDFDFKTFSLLIDKANPVAVTLNSTGAASLKVSGTIDDVLLKRQIRDDNPLVISDSYDLAKLWPIVKPLLSPSTQRQLADLVISGKEARQITLAGSLPADQPFNQAIASLHGGGYLTVGGLSTQGVTINNLDFPFTLRGGIVETVYPDLPETSNAPHPAQCNGGTLNIGVIRVDLRSDPMMLSMPRVNAGTPLAILQNVTINPAMSKSVLGKVLNNPAFSNANQAQGLVTVNIRNLDKMPLSGLLMQSAAQNQGTAVVVYSVTGLQLGSPLLAVFGNEAVSANINNANVKYAHGQVNEDMTMMIDGNKPLRFAGTVILATEQFAPMTAYIPPALFARLIPAQDRQFVPDEVVVPMKGDMNNPKLDLGQAIAQTIKEGAKKQIINGLIQGLQHVH